MMAADMNKVRQQIFVSYSHVPAEESEFARQLAERLRDAGFYAWLDEEQILPGADFEAVIRQEIPASSHGLLLVTRRWQERPYTRLELNLFIKKQNDKTGKVVAVLREEIGELELAPQLQQLNVIKWLPDDPDPDACFWLVYCGLTGRVQGPRQLWGEKGRGISGRHKPPPKSEEPDDDQKPLDKETRLDCRGRPFIVLPSPHGTFLATDADECFLLDPNSEGQQEALSDLQGCSSAVVGPDGTIMVGRYSPMVASCSSAGWEYRSLSTAPLLTLASTPNGVAIGDAAGNVTLFPGSGGRTETVKFGEPVVDLCPFENGLAALGAGGSIGSLGWADEWDKIFDTLKISNFDRPTELFSLGKQARVGLIAVDRLGVLDIASGRVTSGSRTFAAGIRQVVYLERKPGAYGVLTDAGELFLLDADLNLALPVPLPGEIQEVNGICRSPTGGLLAWTPGGVLFSINRERAVRKLASDRIVLALCELATPNQIVVVRWAPNQGAQVQVLHTDAAR
jgi:hypothetical protein